MSNNNSAPVGAKQVSPQEEKFAKIGFELSSEIEKRYPVTNDSPELKRLILQKYLALAKGLLQVDLYYNPEIVARIITIINAE